MKLSSSRRHCHKLHLALSFCCQVSDGKGPLSLPPTAVLEANQKLVSGSVWGLDKAPSVEGSVHVCPEGRMEEDMRILLELVLEKKKKCRRGLMVRCWRERDLLEDDLSKQTQRANATQGSREARANGALQMSSILSDATLPKGF